jgi:hypothetical protein
MLYYYPLKTIALLWEELMGIKQKERQSKQGKRTRTLPCLESKN